MVRAPEPLPSLRVKLQRPIVASFLLVLCFVVSIYVLSVVHSRLLFTKTVPIPVQKQVPTVASQEHTKRRETIRKFCTAQHPNYRIPSTIRRYFSFSERYRLVYCNIQKVGSSFWLQIMKRLIDQRKPKSFFGVKTFHHSTWIQGYYSFLNKTDAETAKLLRSYKKFLFVRDPLSRLFSAYMDKVFVPDPRMFFLAGRRRVRQAKAEEGVGEGEGKEGRTGGSAF